MRWGTLFFPFFFCTGVVQGALSGFTSTVSFNRFNQSVCVPLSFAAKHHCLSQPGRPEWLTLPAGRHGGPSVYVAPGEGGADGWHSGTQRLACGAARRGPLFILFSLSFYLCLHCVYPPAFPLACLPSVSLSGTTNFFYCLLIFLLFPFPLSTHLCYDWLFSTLWSWRGLIDQSTLVKKMRKTLSHLFVACLQGYHLSHLSWFRQCQYCAQS